MEEESNPSPQEAENISTIIGDGLSALNGARAVERGEESNPDEENMSLAVPPSSSTHDEQTALGSATAITTVPSPQQQQQLVTVTKQEPQDTLPVTLSPVPIANTQLVSDMNPPPATSTPTNQQQQRTIANLPPSIPAGKITNYCPKHPHIEVTLDGKELWDEFFRRGTEMIVNRAGRRMFPGFSISISGLKPKSKYTMKLDIVLADTHRFKFLNARWLPVGSAEPQSQYETYIHPDSPNTGTFWMRHGVSFRKLKITNNKDRPGSNALLHSMHKYFLRLYIEEEKKVPSQSGEKGEKGGDKERGGGEEKSRPTHQQTIARPILSIEFPETTFIAVTAYQNEEVTQLKITNNPFAKAFRENAADMDWETAQALYGNSSTYLSPGTTMTHAGSYNYLMSPSPSPWAIHSPMLSPHSMPPSFHSIGTPQAHSLSGTSHYSPESQFRHPLPPTPQADASFFQWPQPQQQRSSEVLHSPYLPPPLVSTYPHTPTPLQHSIIETSPSGDTLTLPDFGSTFATVPTVTTNH
ncbi:PREDICTED: T-box protein 2-like isoform X2 [Amphimedon queenslandica]|uniref:T-box domain-containing protein n=1 Tax=Amphimedon queenslandica TaxID=400682 RepID=A0AAN0J4E8_AMPQE|nr:PREDICTED: T-box protein 2-like isoform X2 [Amphimedon queenslandica]|eukprot:XP_019851875.1 PREDICTED: T-box protein 2-like isoform X2 [Amphimedon queenslandica]